MMDNEEDEEYDECLIDPDEIIMIDKKTKFPKRGELELMFAPGLMPDALPKYPGSLKVIANKIHVDGRLTRTRIAETALLLKNEGKDNLSGSKNKKLKRLKTKKNDPGAFDIDAEYDFLLRLQSAIHANSGKTPVNNTPVTTTIFKPICHVFGDGSAEYRCRKGNIFFPKVRVALIQLTRDLVESVQARASQVPNAITNQLNETLYQESTKRLEEFDKARQEEEMEKEMKKKKEEQRAKKLLKRKLYEQERLKMMKGVNGQGQGKSMRPSDSQIHGKTKPRLTNAHNHGGKKQTETVDGKEKEKLMKTVDGKERHLRTVDGKEKHMKTFDGKEKEKQMKTVDGKGKEKQMKTVDGKEKHLRTVDGKEKHMKTVDGKEKQMQRRLNEIRAGKTLEKDKTRADIGSRKVEKRNGAPNGISKDGVNSNNPTFEDYFAREQLATRKLLQTLGPIRKLTKPSSRYSPYDPVHNEVPKLPTLPSVPDLSLTNLFGPCDDTVDSTTLRFHSTTCNGETEIVENGVQDIQTDNEINIPDSTGIAEREPFISTDIETSKVSPKVAPCPRISASSDVLPDDSDEDILNIGIDLDSSEFYF